MKTELLSLYNAIRGTSYTNLDELEVNTLEDVVFLSYKNDISFIIDSRLSLYEHQSTWCGNMPLRYLFYVSSLFSKITANDNLHGSKTIPLPTPQFIVFFNGTKNIPDRSIHRLSDAYTLAEEEVILELSVLVLNINKGHNEVLMNQCKVLDGYAFFVQKVKEESRSKPIYEAIECAIDICIQEDILADFLKIHRAEVMSVSIFEYDAERHIAMEKEESKAERIVKFAFDNVGNTFSAKSISDYLKSQKRTIDNETVYSYLDKLVKAYILHRCSRYDIKGKEILKTQEKFYVADTSFKYSILGYDPNTVAASLENVVYLELCRRGYTVNIGKIDDAEIDFVAVKQNEKVYVQVTQEIKSENTRKREYDRLLTIHDNYPKYVLRTDEFADGNYNGIKTMHIADFLLSDDY